jgi:hypothetical protein
MPAFFLAVMLRDGSTESFVLVKSRTGGDRCKAPEQVLSGSLREAIKIANSMSGSPRGIRNKRG